MITQSHLVSLVHYDPITGGFTRLKTGKKIPGWPNKNGYLMMQINNRDYLMHRLAWLYTHGRWPSKFIDHVNMVRHDNSFSNLREANHSENACNQPVRCNNKAGLKGVCWNKRNQAWRAQISKNGQKYMLGHFRTPEAAHAAYVEAAQRLHRDFHRATGGRTDNCVDIPTIRQ